jgi:hypothetical protein
MLVDLLILLGDLALDALSGWFHIYGSGSKPRAEMIKQGSKKCVTK